MGIVSKLFRDEPSNGRSKATSAQDRDYIDLSDYAATERTGEQGIAAASTYVKFAQVRALDDLKHFASYVYDGNLLVLDIKAVQSDEILLRRLGNELRKLASDTGGDIAGLGENHILLTPTGIKVDRRQLAVNKETGQVAEAPSRAAAPAPAPRPAPAPAPAAAPAPAPATPSAPPARPNGTRGQRMNGGGR